MQESHCHISSRSSSAVMSFPTFVLVTNVHTLFFHQLDSVGQSPIFPVSYLECHNEAGRLSGHFFQIQLRCVLFCLTAVLLPVRKDRFRSLLLFLPVRTVGGCGFTQPSAYAVSIMARSFSLVDTGSPFRLQVHAASQSAGHTLEVNSGKLCGL